MAGTLAHATISATYLPSPDDIDKDMRFHFRHSAWLTAYFFHEAVWYLRGSILTARRPLPHFAAATRESCLAMLFSSGVLDAWYPKPGARNAAILEATLQIYRLVVD